MALTILGYGAAALLIAAEGWYWLIYFPRAWRDGSNREINDLRTLVRWLGRQKGG